jgi:hypothetical protein
MNVSSEFGMGLCVGLITRPEESYRVCGVSEYDREASIMRRPWPLCSGLIGHALAGIGGSNPAGLITRPEEPYRVCGVPECDREAR